MHKQKHILSFNGVPSLALAGVKIKQCGFSSLAHAGVMIKQCGASPVLRSCGKVLCIDQTVWCESCVKASHFPVGACKLRL